MPLSPYETLGVEPSATPAEVAEAYKALVQIYHPDRYVGMPERVQSEAERKMKEVTEAYAAVKSGAAATRISATTPYQPANRRSQWPKAPRPEESAAADPDAVGEVAEPLAAPLTDYAVGQWNAARRHWEWSENVHAWVCKHGKDMCGTCGATPDAVAAKAGVVRPSNYWRKTLKGDVWVCVSHRKNECTSCGTPPTTASVIDLRNRAAAKAAGASGAQSKGRRKAPQSDTPARPVGRRVSWR